MQNTNLPTSAEVLNALTVLSKVSHHTDRHPLQVAVGWLANFEGYEAQKLHELFVSVGCAVRNFGEVVGEQINVERDGYLRSSEYFDAQACRVYKRATDEFISAFDEAQDVAQTIATNAGEENPQTLDEYEDCADHDV